MPSHLIIGAPHETLKLAQAISPQKIIENPDCLIFPDDEESLKINQVRDIKHFLTRKPYQADTMLVFIPQAHRLTIPAQNALLTTLEEPPDHVVILLTTAYEDRLLPTVISRCILHITKSIVGKSQENDSIDFAIIAKSLETATAGARMAISQEYAFPKTKALACCQSIINHYRRELYKNPQITQAKNMSLAQLTMVRLEQNVDPRLAIEHLFLELLV